MILQRNFDVITAAIGIALDVATTAFAQVPAKKPNIVIIWGDDIGQSDISAYRAAVHIADAAEWLAALDA